MVTSDEVEPVDDQSTLRPGGRGLGRSIRALLAIRGGVAPDLAVTHVSLAIARIVFHAAVLGDLVDVYIWRKSIYLPQHAWVGDIAVPLGLLVSALVVVGYRTRLCLFANYCLLFLILHAARAAYHFDYIVECFAFVFLFAPAPRRFSVDSLLRGPSDGPEALVPRRFVVLMFAALALMYFDSIIWKYDSVSWTSGSAFWLAAGLPIFSAHRLPEWLEIDWLMRGLTYTALFYETVFPLVLIRRLRLPIAATGIGLHLGIAVFFPLPWFGLGVAGLVCFFVDWEALAGPIFRRVRRRTPQRNRVYLEERRVAVAITYAAAAIMALCQAVVIDNPHRRWIVHDVVGIYPHPIFIDLQFNLGRPVLRYETERAGETVEIPSFDEQGYPSVANRLWTELVGYLRFDPEWEALLYRYLAGWFERSGLSPRPIKVFYKEVRLASPVLDFAERKRMEERPWRFAGTIEISPDGVMVTRWEPGFLVRYDPRKLNRTAPASPRTRVIDYGRYEREQPIFKNPF